MKFSELAKGVLAGCLVLASGMVGTDRALAQVAEGQLPKTCVEPEGIPVNPYSRLQPNPFTPRQYAQWMQQRSQQLSYEQWMRYSQQQWIRYWTYRNQMAALGLPQTAQPMPQAMLTPVMPTGNVAPSSLGIATPEGGYVQVNMVRDLKADGTPAPTPELVSATPSPMLVSPGHNVILPTTNEAVVVEGPIAAPIHGPRPMFVPQHETRVVSSRPVVHEKRGGLIGLVLEEREQQANHKVVSNSKPKTSSKTVVHQVAKPKTTPGQTLTVKSPPAPAPTKEKVQWQTINRVEPSQYLMPTGTQGKQTSDVRAAK